ncbi:hypothetical protein SCG7086_CM_00080 [Chlamydiales bacterium SCGC AG-110-P3]|nr:hypothetical protein SCG7086_CM_00080 [Chlamydiales bacterium SCGC AG-110-P3]
MATQTSDGKTKFKPLFLHRNNDRNWLNNRALALSLMRMGRKA